jgi:hypothetical protein
VVENVVNYDIDIHRYHDTHYHCESPRNSREKAAKVWIEADQKPAGDERCEKRMRKHLARVKGWEQVMRTGR